MGFGKQYPMIKSDNYDTWHIYLFYKNDKIKIVILPPTFFSTCISHQGLDMHLPILQYVYRTYSFLGKGVQDL